MAQLIKIQDCISRYETGLIQYANQFLRLKQQRWLKRKVEWESLDAGEGMGTLKEVKEQFLDEIFQFQLRWASSTLHEISPLHPKYEQDPILHFLVKRLPDNYLVLYEPVFQVKNASVELEVVLVAPTSMYCLSFLKGKKDDIFQARSGKFWAHFQGGEERKVMSPMMSLKRMENILRRCLTLIQPQLPLKQVILAPNAYVDYFQPSKLIECHDKRTFYEWHKKLVNNPSPLKHLQLKTARHLLDCCQTYAYERSEIR